MGIPDQMINEHLEILGFAVKERVTGVTGVATSLSFDLFGCVQVVVSPQKIKEDGTPVPGNWFDVGRLVVVGKKRVMEIPKFQLANIEGLPKSTKTGVPDKPTDSRRPKGPAEKPIP